MAKNGPPSSPATANPLVDFVCDTLARSGCEVLRVVHSGPSSFRLSFEDPLLRRSGVTGFLFPLDSVAPGRDRVRTTVRLPHTPESTSERRDAFGLFTSVLLGVEPTRGLFVAFDPSRHYPDDDPLYVWVGARMVRTSLKRGWHTRLREGWETRAFDFAETLVGFRRKHLLRYLEFERIADGLEAGPRALLAEAFFVGVEDSSPTRPPFARSPTRQPPVPRG